MNEFGEPNMGNPSVRFDEGRERVIWILTTTVGSTPASLSCLLYQVKVKFTQHVTFRDADLRVSSCLFVAMQLRKLRNPKYR
jgi:hypothetical protein